jgi:poly-beta-1,6-N-acetyl-D-glucosamine synthase
MIAACFWLGLAALAYVFVGYPVLALAWAAARPRPLRRATHEPPVSVIVAAHNEADRIADRVDNLLALDYPADRLEILVGSDGSTDATVERAAARARGRASVISFSARRGKPAVVNDLVARARGDIVVLADVRQRFAPDALRALVAPFGDPAVGAVSGELVLTADGHERGVGHGVGVYWRYEKAIRAAESRIDSTVGATGAIYAVRRALVTPLAPDTILDDVVIPLRVTARGHRVLFEPAARAFDAPASSTAEELTRKARTIAGNFQLFARERWALDPRRNRLWLQTVSHKALRLLAPLLLAGVLLANLALLHRPLYRVALLAQFLFYMAAAGGFLLRNARRRAPALSVPYVFCLLQWATVLGFIRFVSRRQRVTWERAAPPVSAIDRRVA